MYGLSEIKRQNREAASVRTKKTQAAGAAKLARSRVTTPYVSPAMTGAPDGDADGDADGASAAKPV